MGPIVESSQFLRRHLAGGINARVARYRKEDVERIYQVRGALEGLAAQLASVAGARGDMKELAESDFAFHLAQAGWSPEARTQLGRTGFSLSRRNN